MTSKLFSSEYKKRLQGRIYGMLCELEKEGDWESYLDSILIELLNMVEDENKDNYYLILWRKISSLRYLNYKYFRSTVFDCINFLENEHE